MDELQISLLLVGSEFAVVLAIAFFALLWWTERRWRRRRNAVVTALAAGREIGESRTQKLQELLAAAGVPQQTAPATAETLGKRLSTLRISLARAAIAGRAEALQRAESDAMALLECCITLTIDGLAKNKQQPVVEQHQAPAPTEDQAREKRIMELSVQVETLKDENAHLREEVKRVQHEAEQVLNEYMSMYARDHGHQQPVSPAARARDDVETSE